MGDHTPCLEENVEELNFIRDRRTLRNLVHLVFSCDKFWPGNKIQNAFVLIAGDSEDESVL